MPNQSYNPIQSVGGVAIPCPSKYSWNLSDVSLADAGRTEDGKMHKMRITQKVHLEMEWQNVGRRRTDDSYGIPARILLGQLLRL